jgi:V-type H+-transporting ATPase subunit E
MQLMESKVEIRCREVDLKIVKSVADSALKDFRAALKQFAGIEPPVQISINETDFLPPPPSPNYEGQTCPGGVVLSARGGKIICRNTLDARYELAFQQLLPVIREALFGRRAEIAKPNPDAAAAAAHAKH